MEPGPVVMLLGYRRAAVEAARRLGLRCLVVDPCRGPARMGLAYVSAPGGERAALSGARTLAADLHPDVVLPLTEAGVALAGPVREALGVPGPPAERERLGADKLVMKRALVAAGVPCAPFLPVAKDTRPDDVVGQLGLPLVLKPRRSAGGRGVLVLETRAAVEEALEPGLLAEGFVRGEEGSVETLVAGGRPVFRNLTRYLVPRWASVAPDARPARIESEEGVIVDRALAALGVEVGWTHAEVFRTTEGPVLGDLSLRPPGGGIMELIERAWGFDPWEALLQAGLGRTPELPARPREVAGIWILHPGAGVVRGVLGLEEARELPGVVRVRCRARPGQTLRERQGSREAVGEVVVTATSGEACAARLEAARARVRIPVEPA